MIDSNRGKDKLCLRNFEFGKNSFLALSVNHAQQHSADHKGHSDDRKRNDLFSKEKRSKRDRVDKAGVVYDSDAGGPFSLQSVG